jgi:ankyrin repeat protein
MGIRLRRSRGVPIQPVRAGGPSRPRDGADAAIRNVPRWRMSEPLAARSKEVAQVCRWAVLLVAFPLVVISVSPADIFEAVQRGKVDEVRVYLDKGTDPNVRDRHGNTPLHGAKGSPEIIRLLVEHGADINAQTRYGSTALGEAARCGSMDALRTLLELGADPNLGAPVLEALGCGEPLERVKLLVEHGADPKAQTKHGGWTLLHVAADRGNQEVMQFALDAGIDVNVRDKDGRTPLWRAAHEDGIGRATWSFLVDRDADVWIEDKEHLNIIDWAELLSVWDVWPGPIPADLREKAAARNIHTAAIHGDVEKVRAFLDRGVSPNDRHPRDGKRPLHWAVRMGHLDVVKLLVERGADINAREENGDTPLHKAVHRYGMVHPVGPDVVRFLLDSGAHVNARNRRGETPLYWAERSNGWLEKAAELLRQRGGRAEPREKQ